MPTGGPCVIYLMLEHSDAANNQDSKRQVDNEQRTGRAGSQVLRQVYTHTMADQSEAITGEMLGWFSEIIN